MDETRPARDMLPADSGSMRLTELLVAGMALLAAGLLTLLR